MSAYPYFFIEKYDYHKDKWENMVLYTKDDQGEFKTVEFWPWNGTHEVFSVLGFEEGAEFDFDNIHYDLPVNCSEEIKELYNGFCSDDEFDYKPAVKWFNLADAKLFVCSHPKFIDYEAMDKIWQHNPDLAYEEVEKVYMDNPIKEFVDRVMTYVNMASDFIDDYAPSDIRVIGWMSY